MLQAVVQSYFAINDVQDTIAVQQNKQVVANRFMSYGTFHTFVKPNMRYGISFGGRFTGMQMDIDRLLRQGVAKDNQLAKLANFNASQGARQSANEHLVPEQLFDNPDTEEKEVEGISAVKALQIASEQGQEIITITKENYDKAIAKISLDSGAMEDISNAIRVGKTVTTHANSISYKGWNGSGYIILDERTGTGAYLISGGANGSWVNSDNSLLLSSLAVTTSDAMSDVGDRPWFSKELIAKYRLNQMAKAVGWIGLAASIVLVIETVK